MPKCMQFDTRARSNRKERRKANALAKQTKIVMEGSLAAMPKFILEVKDGVILLFNEHVPYPDGWYWHTNPGPFIGPFESIDEATEAAVIASDPGVEIKIFDTRGLIAKLPHDPPGGRVRKLANDPMRKVELNLALDELERRGLIRKTGDFSEGSPVFAAVDCKLKELPKGLSLLQQNLFRYLQWSVRMACRDTLSGKMRLQESIRTKRRLKKPLISWLHKARRDA